jgi:hypothetical protein
MAVAVKSVCIAIAAAAAPIAHDLSTHLLLLVTHGCKLVLIVIVTGHG